MSLTTCPPVLRRIAISVLLSLAALGLVMGAMRVQAAVQRTHRTQKENIAVADRHTRPPSGTRKPPRHGDVQPTHTRASSQLQSLYTATTVPLARGVSPWPRALAVDESLGLAYLADGDRGTVTVVDGPTFVSTIPVGQRAVDIGVDPATGYVYASTPDPYALFDGHVAIIKGGRVITQVAAEGTPGPVAVDPLHNRVYVGVRTAVPYTDHVVILQRDRTVALPPNVSPGIVALAVDPVRDRAYVLSEDVPSLSVIDGMTKANTEVIQLDGIGVPRDIAVDPVSGLVFVVGQSPFRELGTILVVSDTEQVATLTVGPDPRRMAIDPDRRQVYVTSAGSDTVTILDVTDIVEPEATTVDVGRKPEAIAIDPSRNRAYVSNAGDGTTTVLSGGEIVTTIAAGGGPITVDTERGIAYLAGNGLAAAQDDVLLGRLPMAAQPAQLATNPATGLTYVCNQGTKTAGVLLGTEILATLSLSDTPREVTVDPESGWVYVAETTSLAAIQDTTMRASVPITAHDIGLDPVRGLTYVAGDEVSVLRETDVIGTIDLGHVPRRVAVNRATGLAYVTAGGHQDGFVAIISGTERTGTVDIGGAPDGLAVDPVRDRVFVLHPSQGRLSVIERTRRRFPNVALPRPALDAAVNPLTGEVYVATRGPLVLVQDLSGSVLNLDVEALAVAFDVDAGLAYATTRDNQFVVIRGTDVVARVPVGHRPVDLAVASEAGRVYVANFGSDSVTVIERRKPPEIYLPLIRRSPANESAG